jgi:hypothetical protein
MTIGTLDLIYAGGLPEFLLDGRFVIRPLEENIAPEFRRAPPNSFSAMKALLMNHQMPALTVMIRG